MHWLPAPLLAALAATQPPQGGSVLVPQPATKMTSLVVRLYPSKTKKVVATKTGETLTAYHASSSQCPKLSKSDLALQQPLSLNATRKPFLWTHIHKCAGSSMCALANLNNENMTKAQSTMNCNTCGDTCRISVKDAMACEASWAARKCAYSASLSCTARQHRATSSSFMGQERFVDKQLCPEALNYGIMLREPLERLLSNTHYARTMEGYGAWDVSPEQVLSLIQPNASSCLDGACDDCMNCNTVERSPAAYDNLYVRTLAGYDAFTLPAGQLTRAHLQAAKARLSAYSVVLILDEYENHEAQLRHWLGWTVTALASERVTENEETSAFFTDEQLDTLARANELDYELYCFAKSLAAARTAQTAEVSGRLTSL